ncbi:hypothetical protein [Phocoenobacter skyensis]|uniref:Uncharacterized protein n=1 Tax=Phocoenobacter skyensis TaxID=97481 RepID=A0A1H8A128_9PAST|nr:hypothetical protein [Pasteurella skyensis]MDP8184409.1 hypothetical protein [Pasteurella skyensis]QLB22589.1 hypothetical protein A6B44_04965 [Pasteurella skyensis]SEM63548.1 hypothetical protein SAMN05444853_1339 [Pasteurella skyensis]
MKLSDFNIVKASENTHTFAIVNPVTGEETDGLISIYGSESDVVRKFQAKQLRKLQKKEFENSRTRKQKFTELEELRQTTLENAVVRVAGWENIEWEDEKLEFNEENARKVLKNCPWLCEQIVEQSDDIGNFIKA